MEEEPGPFVLLGARACSAFGFPFAPFKRIECWVHARVAAVDVLVLPHPSGRCHLWNDPATRERAREEVAALRARMEGTRW